MEPSSMLPSTPLLALAGMIPASIIALTELPSTWIQGGIGIVALGILWKVLDRQASASAASAKAQAASAAEAAKARAAADERTAAAHERVALAMEKMAVSDATNCEIQRGILNRVGAMEKTLAHALRRTDNAASAHDASGR